jgi:hypothetical protein
VRSRYDRQHPNSGSCRHPLSNGQIYVSCFLHCRGIRKAQDCHIKPQQRTSHFGKVSGTSCTGAYHVKCVTWRGVLSLLADALCHTDGCDPAWLCADYTGGPPIPCLNASIQQILRHLSPPQFLNCGLQQGSATHAPLASMLYNAIA